MFSAQHFQTFSPVGRGTLCLHIYSGVVCQKIRRGRKLQISDRDVSNFNIFSLCIPKTRALVPNFTFLDKYCLPK